jgi:hypothetical protein
MKTRWEMSIEKDTSGTFMNKSNKVTLEAMVITATLITLITRNNGNNSNRNTDNLGNQANHGNVRNICMILNTSGMCQPTDGRTDIMKLAATFFKSIRTCPIKSQIIMIRQHIQYI